MEEEKNSLPLAQLKDRDQKRVTVGEMVTTIKEVGEVKEVRGRKMRKEEEEEEEEVARNRKNINAKFSGKSIDI